MSIPSPLPQEPGPPSRFRRLVGHAGWVVLAQAIGLVTGFWSIRIVDPATYGAFVTIVTGFGVVAQWLGFRSWEATVKYLAQFHEAGDLRRMAVVLRLGYLMDGLSYGLTCLVLLAAGRWVAVTVLQDAGLANLVSLYGLAALGQMPYATAKSALQVLGKFRVSFWVETSDAMMRLIGVLLVTWLPVESRLAGLVWVNIAGFIWQGWGTWWMARRALGPLPRVPWTRALWGEFAGFRRGIGATLLNSNLIAWLRPCYRGLDQMLITAWLGPFGGGLFATARKISDLVGLAVPGAQAALAPELSRLCSERKYREAARIAKRAAVLLLLVTVPVAALMAAVVGPLLRWWQPEYAAAVPVCRVLLLAITLFGSSGPLYSFLINCPRPSLASVSFAATALTQMLALLALRAAMGDRAGAAGTTFLALAVVAAAVSSLVWYGLSIRWLLRRLDAPKQAA